MTDIRGIRPSWPDQRAEAGPKLVSARPYDGPFGTSGSTGARLSSCSRCRSALSRPPPTSDSASSAGSVAVEMTPPTAQAMAGLISVIAELDPLTAAEFAGPERLCVLPAGRRPTAGRLRPGAAHSRTSALPREQLGGRPTGVPPATLRHRMVTRRSRPGVSTLLSVSYHAVFVCLTFDHDDEEYCW
jgi:hypothetical protein